MEQGTWAPLLLPHAPSGNGAHTAQDIKVCDGDSKAEEPLSLTQTSGNSIGDCQRDKALCLQHCICRLGQAGEVNFLCKLTSYKV